MKIASVKGLNKFDYSILVIGVLLYTLIYAISIISRVQSVEFMLTDPHSIIDSLNSLTTYPYYNMGDSYHSKYYGWTYFSLNFVVLMFSKFLGLVNEESFNIIVRANLFIIGMLLIVTLYTLSRYFFSRALSACIVLYFLVDPVFSHYLLTIHPESLALLLQCVGLIILMDISKGSTFSYQKFIIAVSLFSLSSLAKQPFLIVNVMIGLVFFAWLYKDAHFNLKIKDIAKLILHSSIVFIITFFIIHPYAFLDFNSFVKAQLELSSAHSSVDISEPINIWINELSNSIVFCLNFLTIFALIFYKRVYWVYICSVVLTILCTLLFVYKANIFISLLYLYPLFIFAAFNVVYFSLRITNKLSNVVVKRILLFIALFFISCNTISNVTYSVFSSYYRFFTDGLNTQYITWDYIKTLDSEFTVAYSPDVAMPEPYKSNGCHAWQGCTGYDNLSQVKPEMVILSPDYPSYNYSDYAKYLKENEYKLVKIVKPDYSLTEYTCTNNLRFGFTRVQNHKPVVLNFLNIESLLENVVNCIDDYAFMLDNYNTSAISGLPKYIYKK